MVKRCLQEVLSLVVALGLITYAISSPAIESGSEEKNAIRTGNKFSSRSLFRTSEEYEEGQAINLPGCPPANLTILSCDTRHKYRTSDGTCNNLVYDILAGSAGRPFVRYLPNAYADGMSVIRGEGRFPALPSPRQVSVAMSMASQRPSNPIPISLLVMQWGQFIDHDTVLTPEFEVGDCCEDGTDPSTTHPECRPLDVTGDPFYSRFNITCLKFVRSLAAHPSCVQGPRQHINVLTAFVDGSQVYGSSQKEQNGLRSFKGGKLKIGPGQEELTGTCPNTCPLTFLPIRLNNGSEELFGGDERVEEQPGLTSMHTLLVRLHNNLCDQYLQIHPSAHDETIFQEIRRIVGAIIQKITYGDFLPLVLGSQADVYYDLSPLPITSGYQEYFSDIDPTTPNVFSAAVFRFGHSFIRDFFNLSTTTVHLARSFFQHHLTLTKGSYPSDFLREMSNLPAQPMDQHLVESLTNLLFAEGPNFSHGLDLYSLNIGRARERGIPAYAAWRKYCHLAPIRSFGHLAKFVGSSAAAAFKRVYSSVNDIDLFPAMIAELPASGSNGIVGPTLTCLLGEHFHSLKFGDRFYFENNAQVEPFSLQQLDAIRCTTMSSLICSLTETRRMQPNAFITERIGNRKVPCSQLILNTVQDQLKYAW